MIFTDAKSLLPLFNKITTKSPPRIEIQILAMQHLDYEFVYRPGKDNPTDFLSRNPTDSEASYLDQITNELEESIVSTIRAKMNYSASKSNITEETLQEETLSISWISHSGKLHRVRIPFHI